MKKYVISFLSSFLVSVLIITFAIVCARRSIIPKNTHEQQIQQIADRMELLLLEMESTKIKIRQLNRLGPHSTAFYLELEKYYSLAKQYRQLEYDLSKLIGAPQATPLPLQTERYYENPLD
jgi:hypothetical protein